MPSSLPRYVPKRIKNLQVRVYSSGVSEIVAPELRQAEVIRCDGHYDAKSGGIYSSAEIFVPRKNPRAAWLVKDKQRVAIYRGVDIIWEGVISEIGDNRAGGGRGVPGNVLRCVGFWGWIMDGDNPPMLNKPWAITDVSDSVWKRIASVSAADLCDIHRTGGVIRFIPKLENWANGQVARVEFSAPTGQTVKHVQFDWEFAEASNAYAAFLLNGDATTIWTITDDATPTGSEDFTTADTGLAHQTLRFELRSAASQTSAASDGEYLEISNLIVATEEGTIDADTIGVDIVGEHAGINASTLFINPDALSLTDLESGGADFRTSQTFGAICRHVAKFGDQSFNPVAFNFVASTEAATPNGLPLLRMHGVPALTDFEYLAPISGDGRIQVPSIFRQSYGANDIIVIYREPEGLDALIVTSDDDANLKDSDLVTADGSRVFVLDVGRSTQANAILAGRAELTEQLKPVYYMSGPIIAKGTIDNKTGADVDVALVQAGERVKIPDYIDDQSGQVGKGLILLITGVSKTNDGRTVAITAGVSDDMSQMIRKDQQRLLLETTLA